MIRRILWLLPIGLMAASAFWGYELSDYRQGYKQAAQDAERLRSQYGWVADVGASVLREELAPQDESKSPRWQEGYRQAMHDYLQKTSR